MASTRPRSERAHRAILRAALRLCVEHGFANTSVDAIAKEAGVGKQTIYRWWPSKAAVVVEAIDEAAAGSAGFPDTGDIVADLRTQMADVARTLRSGEIAPYKEVIGAAQSDPAVAKTILDRLIAPRVEDCRIRLEQAQRQGQLRAGVDLEDMVELLYAPLYYRLLLHTRPITPGQVENILDLVFHGVTPPPAATLDHGRDEV